MFLINGYTNFGLPLNICGYFLAVTTDLTRKTIYDNTYCTIKQNKARLNAVGFFTGWLPSNTKALCEVIQY